jgi:hypothetical protein
MTVKILTDHLKEVSSVYSGRHGCACGCRGNHTSMKKMIVGIASTAVALRATACGSSTAATPAPHYNDGGSFMPAYIPQLQAPPKNHACEPTEEPRLRADDPGGSVRAVMRPTPK